MANQYTNLGKYDTLRYSPESFKDMAVAPIAMRQRHDNANQFNDDLLLQLDNIEVPEEFQEQFNTKKNAIKENINSLTSKINEIGAGNSNLMGEFRNMKRDYNSQVSNSGYIGRLKNMQDDFKSKYASAMDLNIRQKQNPESGKKNFDIDRAEYMKSISPDDLSNPNAGIKKFEPRYAPEYTDVVDEHKRVQGLIGKHVKQVNWNNVELVPNPASPGEYMYRTKQGVEINSSNEENLKAVNELMKSSALSPNSKIGQSIQWMNPDKSYAENMQDFLRDSKTMTAVMAEDMHTKNTQIKETDPYGGSRGSNKTSTDKEDEKGTLVDFPTGAKDYQGMDFSEYMSESKLKNWEKKEEDGSMTEKDILEKNAYLSQQTRVRLASAPKEVSDKINAQIEKDYKALQKEMFPSNIYKNKEAPKNKEELTSIINEKENILRKAIPGNYDSTLKAFEEMFGKKPGYMPGAKNVQTNDMINSMRSVISQDRAILNKSLKGNIPESDLLYSKLYKFGSGKLNNDLNKEFIESVNYNSSELIGLARNSGGLFSAPGMGMDGENYQDFNTGEKDAKSLQEKFVNGKAKITGMSLVSMGATGSSQLVFDYQTGDTASDKLGGKIAIDYDNKSSSSSVLEGFLEQMKKGLDDEGKSIIQSMQDNKKLAPLSVDSSEYAKKGMSDSQSNTFVMLAKAEAKSSYSELESYKKVDYTSVKGRKFNMVRSDDGYFELYIGGSIKASDTAPLNTKYWMKREMAKSYGEGSTSIPDLTKASTREEKIELIKWGKDFAETATKQEGVTKIGKAHEQEGYQKLRREYLIKLEENQDNLEAQTSATMSYFEQINGMKISHRNKIRFM